MKLRRSLHGISRKASFAIAFDIDGVLIRGSKPLPGASKALGRLILPQVPFILFTNGGGFSEKQKAEQLSSLLSQKLSPSQIFLSHTSFKDHASSFETKRTLAIGKGEPARVLSEYGFRNVVAIEDYVNEFDNIDPLEQYKYWKQDSSGLSSILTRSSDKIEAVFVVSDPVDWGRDIQVVCDVLRGGGDPLNVGGKAPPLYFAADDLVYQAGFPIVRLGMGAFRVALESVYNRLTGTSLVYTSYGKPNAIAYAHVYRALQQQIGAGDKLRNIYMVGDNPATDIRGAKEVGKPWFSILVRSGCFKGAGNDDEFPADEVVDDVEEAVNFILKREAIID